MDQKSSKALSDSSREDKGYGFIERDQGGDLFVHIGEVDEKLDALAKGQRVSFERASAGGPASSRQETSL